MLPAAVVAPPVGLVLLWTRSRARLLTKILASLVIAGFGTIYTIAVLVRLFGMRAEMDGSGMWPLFTFHQPETHYAELERSRQAPPVADAAAPDAKAAPATSHPAPSNYWTDFRGPNRDGRYDEMPILTQWPGRGLPRLWKQPVGGGYASFVVAGGMAFTIEQRRQQEVVAAYDLATGKQIWTHGWNGQFQEGLGGDGPRATPVWHQGRLYALGAEGEFRCLEAATGKQLWGLNILTENQAQNITWGMANSPLIVDDKVIVLPGGSPGKSVVAYDKVTGKPVWKALDDKPSYTSPMLVTLGGRRQLLVVSARRAMGLTVEEGALLWEYPWTTEFDINSAQPIVVGENRFFISASYGHGAAVLEITPAGGAGFTARALWQNTRMKNKFNASVLFNGYIYGLDESILACIDAATGELKWKGGRYGYGQVLLASGHLVVLTESGDVVLVKATPERHQEVASFQAIEGKTWNNPALAGGLLLVRNTTEMACFRISP